MKVLFGIHKLSAWGVDRFEGAVWYSQTKRLGSRPLLLTWRVLLIKPRKHTRPPRMTKMGVVRQEFASRRPFQLEPDKQAKVVETNSNARNIWCVLKELANHANWFVV